MTVPERDLPTPSSPALACHPSFPTTQWTAVLSAGRGDPNQSAEALELLCSKYWYPIYAFIRWRRGLGHHEAEDFAQGFFEHLLRNEGLKTVARAKGKFRNFLLASLTNFLNDERDRLLTSKRGGRWQSVSWDGLTAEDKYKNEQVGRLLPEQFFDRAWAFALFEQACGRLQSEYEDRGRGDLFAELRPFLTEPPEEGFFDHAASRLGMRAETVKVALHRLRRELGRQLRQEVAATVGETREIKEEIRFLLGVVGQ